MKSFDFLQKLVDVRVVIFWLSFESAFHEVNAFLDVAGLVKRQCLSVQRQEVRSVWRIKQIMK